MKGKRRFGILLIIAALIIMQLPVSEADAATSASDFKIEGSTLVKYRGDETQVTIPDRVEIIGEGAFEENDNIESVVIPNSVTWIERYAFWGCDNLKTVTLGKGIQEIGPYTFANCKGLKQITIPTNVKSIGLQAFVDCVNLTDITIPVETIEIHEAAFDGCFKLYIHCTPGSFADEYAQTFYEKQEEMPEYEDVPEYQEPEIPEENETDDSVIYDPVPGRMIGSTQVVGNNAMVFIEGSNQTVLDGSAVSVEEQEPIENTMQTTQGNNVPKYTIVDGSIVADQAYYRSKALGHVTLPAGIEEIGLFAFSRSSISSVVIPEGTKEICYGAFYHCDKLEKVILPKTIENVEPKAFKNTLWVEEFEDNGKEDYLISGNVLVAYRGINKEITIPEGVTVIAGEVFANNAQIIGVTLPDSLITIGEGAFEGCRNLNKVSFGSSTAKIKDRAFAGCAFNTISIPASVKEVGLKVFNEEVVVTYEGGSPAVSHEQSAERLSNEDYRPLTEDSDPAGVHVSGVDSITAGLEGADKAYYLTVSEADDCTAMESAYKRSYGADMPEAMQVYDLQLTDNSGIPITKLGKRILSVTMPVPEELKEENIIVFALDRNGQLEKIKVERIKKEDVDSIRFETSHLSLFGICGDGSVYTAEEVLEVSTSIQSMSRMPGEPDTTVTETNPVVYLKWGTGLILLLLGTLFVLSRDKKRA